MAMMDWVGFLSRFMELSSYPILEDKVAKLKVESEYEVVFRSGIWTMSLIPIGR